MKNERIRNWSDKRTHIRKYNKGNHTSERCTINVRKTFQQSITKVEQILKDNVKSIATGVKQCKSRMNSFTEHNFQRQKW